MNSKQFTQQVSNQEIRKRVVSTYIAQVKPFLEANRKAYNRYLQQKKNQ